MLVCPHCHQPYDPSIVPGVHPTTGIGGAYCPACKGPLDTAAFEHHYAGYENCKALAAAAAANAGFEAATKTGEEGPQ